MLEGDSVEGTSPPVTSGTPKRESDQTPNREHSRELKGLTDQRYIEHHPRHDSVFTHGSATASRSNSVAPSTIRRTMGSALSNAGKYLEMVSGASLGEEGPVSGIDLRLSGLTEDRVTTLRQVTTGKGKGKMKCLPQTNLCKGLAVVERKEEVGRMSDDDDRDKEEETTAVQSGCCTRSQLGCTAPPETIDAAELCTHCRIRARTSGAQDCAW